MPVFFLCTIECSSRRQQTFSSGPAVLSPCPLVACSFQVRVAGRSRSCFHSLLGHGGREIKHRVSVCPGPLWPQHQPHHWVSESVSLFWHHFFLPNISNSTNELIDLNSRNLGLFLYNFFSFLEWSNAEQPHSPHSLSWQWQHCFWWLGCLTGAAVPYGSCFISCLLCSSLSSGIRKTQLSCVSKNV